jgi:hypothetical protein
MIAGVGYLIIGVDMLEFWDWVAELMDWNLGLIVGIVWFNLFGLNRINLIKLLD